MLNESERRKVKEAEEQRKVGRQVDRCKEGNYDRERTRRDQV